MNDKIELSAADKARLVLEATWRGKRWKRAPLDDKAAEALGRNLESAAQITGANPSFPLCFAPDGCRALASALRQRGKFAL